jgi:ABC-type cobalamin transport system permease subunit
MKKVLTLAAVVEAATGLALIIVPSLIGRLLFGTEFTGVANPAARVTGIALLALGVGCWPGSTAFCGMLTYSALVTLYLLSLAIRGEWVGPLLWPVVALHGILTVLLAWAGFQSRLASERRTTP